jgi:hypothetical protein
MPAQLGVAICPCTGDVSEDDYASIVAIAQQGLTGHPELLLEPLADRMTHLADEERFEEAAEVRDRASALDRRDRIDGLRHSGRLRLVVDGASVTEFRDGRLVTDHRVGEGLPTLEWTPGGPTAEEPLAKEQADELHCVASWLKRDAHRIVVEHCDGTLVEPVHRTPDFQIGPDRSGGH